MDWRSVAGTSRNRLINIASALEDSDDSDSDLDELVDGADEGWTDTSDETEHEGDGRGYIFFRKG